MKIIYFLGLLCFATKTLAYETAIDGIYYNIDIKNKTAEVTQGNYGNIGKIAIPATIVYLNETYNVTSIGDDAFYNCYTLSSIDIPTSVTHIEINAFNSCCNLTEINVSDENPKFSSVEGILYNKDFSTIFCYPQGKNYQKLFSFTIPKTVTNIGDNAFYYCTNLTSINIPNTVTRIGNNAFSGCI